MANVLDWIPFSYILVIIKRVRMWRIGREGIFLEGEQKFNAGMFFFLVNSFKAVIAP